MMQQRLILLLCLLLVGAALFVDLSWVLCAIVVVKFGVGSRILGVFVISEVVHDASTADSDIWTVTLEVLVAIAWCPIVESILRWIVVKRGHLVQVAVTHGIVHHMADLILQLMTNFDINGMDQTIHADVNVLCWVISIDGDIQMLVLGCFVLFLFFGFVLLLLVLHRLFFIIFAIDLVLHMDWMLWNKDWCLVWMT